MNSRPFIFAVNVLKYWGFQPFNKMSFRQSSVNQKVEYIPSHTE